MQSTLMAHSKKFGSQLVTLDALTGLAVPERLGSRHQPVPHATLVEAIQAEATGRGYTVAREQYALSKDGSKLFGVLDFESTRIARGTSFGFRSSTDSSLAIKAVAGSRVFVCDNLALSGDMIAFLRKSTTGLVLRNTIAAGFDKFLQHEQALEISIARLEATLLTDGEAKQRIFDLFDTGVLPVRLFAPVSQAYFTPDADATDCQPRTEWGVHNACTRALRALSPVNLFRTSTALGKAFGLGRA